MAQNPFEKICRLCLSTDGNLVGIFSDKKPKSRGKPDLVWRQTIRVLLDLEVHPEDSLPHKICSVCVSVLQNFDSFKQKCHDSDRKLHQMLEKGGELEIQDQTEEVEVEVDCFEHEDSSSGDQDVLVVDVDPKHEYQSSEEDTCDGSPKKALPKQPTEADLELEVAPVKVAQPEPSSSSNILQVVEAKTSLMEQSTLHIVEKSIIKLDILSNCSQIISDFNTAEEHGSELESSQNPGGDEVDDHVMQDIIVAVLGDPNCIDLETVENGIADDGTSPVEVYICRFCDAAFATLKLLETHEEGHDSADPYSCGVCKEFRTSQREALISHLRLAHKEKRPWSCFHCSKSFKKRADLRNHAVSHAGLKKYSCAICNKNFGRRNNLRHHLKLHTGERFYCGSCQKSFSTKHALLEHEDYHKNSENYKCQYCQQLITRRRRLGDHERSCFKRSYQDLDPENVMVINLDPDLATPDLQFENDEGMNDEDVGQFTCDICLKSFSTKRVLRHHKNTHGTKKHVCEYCDRAFLRRNELLRHVVSVHQQSKGFKCFICEKAFSRKDKLLRHERIHSKVLAC